MKECEGIKMLLMDEGVIKHGMQNAESEISRFTLDGFGEDDPKIKEQRSYLFSDRGRLAVVRKKIIEARKAHAGAIS